VHVSKMGRMAKMVMRVGDIWHDSIPCVHVSERSSAHFK
jgi:hypothetical protein